MYIFVFHKPKKTIKNILFIVALISLFISLVAISTVVLWQFYPTTVSALEKELHDPYRYKVRKLYKNTRKATTEEEKFERFVKLYTELRDITILNKYYHYRQKAAIYLINYHLKAHQYKQAKVIADKWKKQYPFDFTGKFQYAKVLEANNVEEALLYYAELYSQYKEVPEIVDHYLELLVRAENVEMANKIQLETEPILKKQIEFTFYYKESADEYSEKQTFIIDQSKYTVNDDRIDFEFEQTFSQLSGLRLKLQSIPFQFKIWKLKTVLIYKDVAYDLNVQSMDHMKKEGGVYTLLDNTPSIDFNIPSALTDNKGTFKINVSMHTGFKK